MRKLMSKEDRDKKQRRNQILAGVVLGIVMVISVLGFAIQGALGNNTNTNTQQGTTSYNGFQFTNSNGVWILGNFVFQSSPMDASNFSSAINGTLNGAATYQNLPVYIYSENPSARIEAYANLGNIAQRVQDACISGVNCTENVPVKTCADHLIIIKDTNSTGSIRQDGGCVYIEGPNNELVNLTDTFLYNIIGVN